MELIPWEEFFNFEAYKFADAEATIFSCPKCGRRVFKETGISLACYPPKHRYFCGTCNWAVECGFGYDNIPEEYEKYKEEIEGMGYTEGLIYIAEKEVE